MYLTALRIISPLPYRSEQPSVEMPPAGLEPATARVRARCSQGIGECWQRCSDPQGRKAPSELRGHKGRGANTLRPKLSSQKTLDVGFQKEVDFVVSSYEGSSPTPIKYGMKARLQAGLSFRKLTEWKAKVNNEDCKGW